MLYLYLKIKFIGWQEEFTVMQYSFGQKNPTDPKARSAAELSEYATNYTEYTVVQKAEGVWLIRRILMILFYAAYTIAFFLLPTIGPVKIPMLIALLPVTLWIVIFFTWRFVSVEHEYTVCSGVMTFTDILGGRTRRVLFAVSVKDMTEIAPLPADALSLVGVHETVDLRGSKSSLGGYYFTVKNEKGETAAVLFTATQKALKILRYYNPSAFREA